MSNPRSYGIDTAVESEGFTGKYFPAGMVEGVLLKSVKYDLASTKEGASPDGAKGLIFTFTSEDGALTHRHIEWELVEKRELENAEKLYNELVKKGETPTTQKVDFINNLVDKSYASQQKRIKHILTKFMPEEKAVIPPSNSFEQFSKNVERLLTPNISKTPMRAIFVYDSNGYVKFPTFVPFLEVIVADTPATLKINEKYHRVTPPAPKAGAPGSSGYRPSTPSQDDDF